MWKQARRTKTVREGVFGVLCSMAGERKRCMYCEDSRGTDIDHFWPKSAYPQRTFQWVNMLLSCSGCQRAKGDRFPLNEAGEPLLIDPTAEDPWEYLFYVSQTGVITARFDPGTGQESPKGLATTDLLPLNDEAISSGRKRVSRRLVDAVQGFLDAAEGSFAGTAEDGETSRLRAAIRESPDYGLSRWYFAGAGQGEEPFRSLKHAYPKLFEELAHVVSP